MKKVQNCRYIKPLFTLLVVIVFLIFANIIVPPKTAFAELPVIDPAGTSVDIAIETDRIITEKTNKLEETIGDKIEKVLIRTAAINLKNLAVTVAQDLAEQSVNWLETGEWGQQPVWQLDTWSTYVDRVREAVLTDVLSELSTAQPWADKFDICEPSLDVKLRVIRSLEVNTKRNPFDAQVQNRRCSWNKVKDRWSAFADELQSKYVDNPSVASFVAIEQVVKGFEPKQSDIGTYLYTYDLAESAQREQEQVAKEERLEGEGSFKPKTDITGTTIQNPPDVSKELLSSQISKTLDAPASEEEKAWNVIESIPEAIGSTFLNSFVSQRFVNALFDRISQGYVSNSYNPSQGVFDYKTVAENQISRLKKIGFKTSSREIDQLTEFTTCDPGTINRGPNNCVITEDFADAVRTANYGTPLTVQEALNQQLIPNLAFISPQNSDNLDDDCYLNGYCYYNLVKLRKARIIPIGWELAAQAVSANGDPAKTLSFMLGCFNAPAAVTSCDPYRYLVDPDWVLKYPKARCDAVASGPTLLASNTTDRAEYCADVKSCVATDEEGNCHYAYCAAEENVWKFTGDICPAVADSCTTLTQRDGKKFNYLLNTVDFGSCDANSVGCLGYSSWLTSSTATDRVWAENYPADYYKTGSSIVHLNSQIETESCSPNDEGCTRVINTSNRFGANLVPNSNFDLFVGEANDTTADMITGWNNSEADNFIVTDTGYQSSNSVSLGASGQLYLTQDLQITPLKYSRYYLFSAVVSGSQVVELIPTVARLNYSMRRMGGTFDVTFTSTTENLNPLNDSYIYTTQIEDLGGGWQRINKIVRLAPDVAYLGMRFSGIESSVIDEVQISEAVSPFEVYDYSDYGTIGLDFIKIAPDYYGCYDSALYTDPAFSRGIRQGETTWYTPVNVSDILDKTSNNSEKCSDFAELCAAEEVGCQLFNPTDGGTSVTAVASPEDLCPSQCVGYATYSQASTNFVSTQFPLYFMPSTAESCSANQVSCEEFTNLDDLDAGGEGTEYYSDLRLCKKSDNPETDTSCGTYYTWVGTDVSGYQLQAHQFEMNNSVPKVVQKSPITRECSPSTFDPINFPECRELYDKNGNVSYYILDNLVLCSQNCHPYRRTLKYDAEIQCTSRGGEWRADNECVFWANPDFSKSCDKSNAGCREYRGNTANDVDQLLNDTFDASTIWTGGEISQRSSINGGKSLKLTSGQTSGRRLSNSLIPGESYIVSFWAESPGSTARADINLGSSSLESRVEIQSTPADQTQFLHYDTAIFVPTEAVNEINIQSNSGTIYFDSIEVKRLSDTHYLITNSWSTPTACDQTLSKQYLPQAQLGCREFESSVAGSQTLRGFRNICRQSAVGCQAVIDTQNSTNPFSQSYDNDNGAFTTDQDNLMYLVLSDDVRCKVFGIGCTMLGVPNYDQNNQIESDNWATNFFKLDFDNLDKYLCLGRDNRCDEFTTSDNNTYYFKEPGERTCEYKVGSDGNEGWFVTGTEDSCPSGTFDYYADGTGHLLHSSTATYDGWVGQCKSKYDSCTAFLDPVDVEGGSTKGSAYYYLNNEDIQSCSTVSEKDGCLLFNDTSVKNAQGFNQLLFNSASTYEASSADGGRGVSPLANSTDQALQGLKLLLENLNIDCSLHTNYCPEVRAIFNQPDTNSVERTAITNSVFALLGTTPSASAGPVGVNQCTYESVLCYAANEANIFQDSNRIIKVVRDRECAEWYDCKSGQTVFDPVTNTSKFVCQGLGLCDAIGEAENTGQCSHFVSEGPSDSLLTTNQLLNATNYTQVRRTQGVSWGQLDYSGYSISNRYPLQFYNSYNINARDNALPKDYRLVHLTSQTCTSDDACGAGRRCLGDVCVEGVATADIISASSAECRAYPQADSPFNASVKKLGNQTAQAYENVLTCEGDENFACGCAYTKVSFGGGYIDKYFPNSISQYIETDKVGFCQDIPDRQCACAGLITEDDNITRNAIDRSTMCESYDCSDSGQLGMCMKKDIDRVKYLGMQGYCLERDGSLKLSGQGDTACLSWYPVDSLSGLQDLYAQYDEAGYDPNAFENDGGRLYCLGAAGLETDDTPYEDPISYRARIFDDYRYYIPSGGNDYREYFTGYSGEPLYKQDLIGFSFACNEGQDEDWCEGESATTWYEKSHSQDFQGYNFFKKSARSINPSGSAPNTLVTGNLSTYNFTRDQDKYRQWTYWQITWSEKDFVSSRFLESDTLYQYGGSGKKLGEFDDDKYLMFVKDGGVENKDLITNEVLGDAEDVFKPIPAGVLHGVNWSSQGCTEDNDCGNGKCIKDSYYGNYCSNVQCNPATDYDLNPAQFPCNNNANQQVEGETIWYCQSDQSQVGYCNYNTLAQSARQINSHCWGEDNYFGVRVLFDENDQFKGVWASICDDSNSIGWQDFTLDLLKGEYCQDVIQVVEEDALGSNKAYTDNFYKYLKTGDNLVLESGATHDKLWDATTRSLEYGLSPTTALNPFGSAYGSAVSTDEGDPVYVPFDSTNDDGTDLAENPGGTPFFAGLGNNAHTAGKPISCEGGETANCDNVTKSSGYSVFINNLFANVYNRWIYQNDKYVNLAGSMPVAGDFALTNSHQPPIVAGVVFTGNSDPITGNETSAADINTISIGTQSRGDIRYSGEDYSAQMTFYAWANSNQMPITSVLVDWNDGSTVVGLDEGKLKNHKPVCQQLAGELLQRCKIDNAGKYIPDYACRETTDCPVGTSCLGTQYDVFGDTTDACSPQEFFKFEHRYTCEGQGDRVCSGSVISNCWNATEQACQFIPQVQVKDSWGWCNGSCGHQKSTWVTDGCYEGECSRTAPEPWTRFAGRILIKP